LRSFKVEDRASRTVADAAKWERERAARLERIEEKHYDEVEEEVDEDPCGCSDPGCPCSGRKRGRL